jgi:hypothetical protein
MQSPRPEAPVVLVKAYNYTKWLLDCVENFPKSQRFILGQRLTEQATDAMGLPVKAYAHEKTEITPQFLTLLVHSPSLPTTFTQKQPKHFVQMRESKNILIISVFYNLIFFHQPGIGSSDPRAMASPITQAQTALMRRLSRIIWRNENRKSVQFTCSMGGGSSRCFR